MWSNVERYKAKVLFAEDEAEKRAIEGIKTLEKAFGSTLNAHQELILANARIESTQAAYRAAVKRAEVGSYVLANLQQFMEPLAIETVDKLNSSLRENILKQGQVRRQLFQLREQADKSLKDWYRTRQSRLDWIDFLYFSVGVSTTTTFGDIVPNSRLARLLVLFQLVVSVLLVGYLVGHLASRPR